MADKILPKGMRMFAKKDTQPQFVIGTLIVTLDDLAEFFKEQKEFVTQYQGKNQLKFQVLMSQKNEPYLSLDTYKPANAVQPQERQQAPSEAIEVPDTSDLPF